MAGGCSWRDDGQVNQAAGAQRDPEPGGQHLRGGPALIHLEEVNLF